MLVSDYFASDAEDNVHCSNLQLIFCPARPSQHPSMKLFSILFVIRVTVGLSDLNCTYYEAGLYKYSFLATSCSNKDTETMCRQLFGGGTGKAAKMSESASERPPGCYQVGGQFNSGIKKAALATCAQYCGFCCQTPEYNCENVQCKFERILSRLFSSTNRL